MNSESYNLCSRQFEKNICESFKSFRNDEAFSDVTLVSEDGMQARAHKLVLGSSSKFFRNTFLRNPHQQPLIFLKGVEFKNLEGILEFIYLGETSIEEKDLDSFISLSRSLEIKGLEDPEDLMKENSQTVYEVKDVMNDEQVLEGITQESSSIKDDDQDCQDKKKVEKPSDDPNINRVKSFFDGKKKSKYTCNLCDYESNQIGNVKVHIDAKHEMKKFGCSECEKECNSVSSLLYHKKSKHDGFRITCTFCDSKFTSPQGLKIHLSNIHA